MKRNRWPLLSDVMRNEPAMAGVACMAMLAAVLTGARYDVHQENNGRELQAQMALVRRKFRSDVEEVVERARHLTDWKSFVAAHPWLTLAAAGSLGYLLVPRRQPPTVASEGDHRNTAQAEFTPKPAFPKVINGLLAMVAAAAVRQGVSALGTYLKLQWTGSNHDGSQESNEWGNGI